MWKRASPAVSTEGPTCGRRVAAGIPRSGYRVADVWQTCGKSQGTGGSGHRASVIERVARRTGGSGHLGRNARVATVWQTCGKRVAGEWQN